MNAPHRFLSKLPIVASVTAVATIALGVSVPAGAQAQAVNFSEPYTWVEEFESPDALDGWNIFRQPDYGNKDSLYTADALSIEDGKLTITTQRHCVDEDIDLTKRANHSLLNDETASVSPCGPDQFEKFTSGRLASPAIARGEFTVDVTATIQSGDVEGVRSAIWMQNTERACSTPNNNGLYGELDLVEHFSYDARAPWSPSNTHLGCNPATGTNKAPRELKLDESLSGAPHTWSVSVDQNSVAYSLDGNPVNRKSWEPENVIGHATREDFGLSPAEYRDIIDQPWTLTLNQKVEYADWARPRASNLDFPIRKLIVDRIEVKGAPYAEDEIPGEPTPNDPPAEPGQSEGLTPPAGEEEASSSQGSSWLQWIGNVSLSS